MSGGLVDGARNYTPWRVVAKKGKLTLTYTDHFPVIVDLQLLKSSQGMELKKQLEWNTSKQGGSKSFEHTWKIKADKIAELAKNEKKHSSEELVRKVEVDCLRKDQAKN